MLQSCEFEKKYTKYGVKELTTRKNNFEILKLHITGEIFFNQINAGDFAVN